MVSVLRSAFLILVLGVPIIVGVLASVESASLFITHREFIDAAFDEKGYPLVWLRSGESGPQKPFELHFDWTAFAYDTLFYLVIGYIVVGAVYSLLASHRRSAIAGR